MPNKSLPARLSGWLSNKLRSTLPKLRGRLRCLTLSTAHCGLAMNGLLALSLSLSLSGCSSTKYLDQPVLPPAYLLEDCRVPANPLIHTNGDLITHIGALRAALAACTIDKQGLREWANTQ